jgi:peptidoglycan/LPS O-acetylase OafA/YrhL
LLIASVAMVEQSRAFSVPGWLRILGGASYSIYLFQFVFIGLAWQTLQAIGLGRAAPHWVQFAILSAAAILGGVFTTRFVEQPLLRAIRSGTGRKQTKPLPT